MALYEVYVDGSSRGQGQQELGYAACAMVIYKNRKLVGQYARGLGRANNNQAEYEAVLLGVQASWIGDLDNTVIYTDSQLVANQVNGIWDCNDPVLFPLLFSIQEIQAVHAFKLVQVQRREIHQADYLVHQFLDSLQEQAKKLKPKSEERK